jgi:hypothetical protein
VSRCAGICVCARFVCSQQMVDLCGFCLGCMHRFVCDFVDEVPDGIFECLTPSAQAAFQTVSAVGVKSRIRAQYYIMAMHSWTLADALGSFQVCHTNLIRDRCCGLRVKSVILVHAVVT